MEVGSRKQITLFVVLGRDHLPARIPWINQPYSSYTTHLNHSYSYAYKYSKMKFSGALLALLPFLATALASDVLDLTESTFKSSVLGEDLALVE